MATAIKGGGTQIVFKISIGVVAPDAVGNGSAITGVQTGGTLELELVVGKAWRQCSTDTAEGAANASRDALYGILYLYVEEQGIGDTATRSSSGYDGSTAAGFVQIAVKCNVT